MTSTNIYDAKYGGQEYYWGKLPSRMCSKVLEILAPAAQNNLTLLDLGCGEGRNAVHFARRGFTVTGLDTSAAGLKKAQRLAQENQVNISTISEASSTTLLRRSST